MLAVDLLHGLHVVFKIDDGMFPCLQALSQKPGGLETGVSWSTKLHVGFGPKSLTLEGSTSGTASSLMRLMLVAARDGMLTVGDVAVDILAR